MSGTRYTRNVVVNGRGMVAVVTLDLQKLAQQLATKAITTKGRNATAIFGAVKVQLEDHQR